MIRIKKKGLSGIVATLLIILITITAITIIWAAIIPMINDELNGGLTEEDFVKACKDHRLIFTGNPTEWNQFAYHCVDGRTGEYTLYSTVDLKEKLRR